MKFRTQLEPFPSKPLLSYARPTLFLGSCFANSIGNRSNHLFLPVLVNPFGTLYHPRAIRMAVELAVNNSSLPEIMATEQGGLWHSYAHHSDLSARSNKELRQHIAEANSKLLKFLETARTLVISLGSAWQYRLIEGDEAVANCHKQPASFFKKELSGADECTSELEGLIKLLKQTREELDIIVTVSPVRHLRDGLIDNNRSKARLIISAESLEEKDLAHYFPAYEYLIDDLRDYRWFGRDLTHPSEEAVDYIWEQVKEHLIPSTDHQYLTIAHKLQKLMEHRPKQLIPQFSKQQFEKGMGWLDQLRAVVDSEKIDKLLSGLKQKFNEE